MYIAIGKYNGDANSKLANFPTILRQNEFTGNDKKRIEVYQKRFYFTVYY